MYLLFWGESRRHILTFFFFYPFVREGCVEDGVSRYLYGRIAFGSRTRECTEDPECNEGSRVSR